MYKSLAIILAAMIAGSGAIQGNINNQTSDAISVDANQYANSSFVGENQSDAIANLNLGNKVEVNPKAGVDKAVAIKISYENESMDDAAQKFIQQINTIFANCNVEDEFNYVSFQAEFHKNASAFLTFYNYGGPDSDYTTEMFTFGNMPEFENAYKNSNLYSHDKGNLFE